MLTPLTTLWDDHQHACISNHVDVILHGDIQLHLHNDYHITILNVASKHNLEVLSPFKTLKGDNTHKVNSIANNCEINLPPIRLGLAIPLKRH